MAAAARASEILRNAPRVTVDNAIEHRRAAIEVPEHRQLLGAGVLVIKTPASPRKEWAKSLSR